MFFIGMLWGGAIAVLVMWLVNKGYSLKWYEWLMGASALLFAQMAVQHFIGSGNELEPTAGTIGTLIFGVIALLLYAITITLVMRRNKSTA